MNPFLDDVSKAITPKGASVLAATTKKETALATRLRLRRVNDANKASSRVKVTKRKSQDIASGAAGAGAGAAAGGGALAAGRTTWNASHLPFRSQNRLEQAITVGRSPVLSQDKTLVSGWERAVGRVPKGVKGHTLEGIERLSKPKKAAVVLAPAAALGASALTASAVRQHHKAKEAVGKRNPFVREDASGRKRVDTPLNAGIGTAVGGATGAALYDAQQATKPGRKAFRSLITPEAKAEFKKLPVSQRAAARAGVAAREGLDVARVMPKALRNPSTLIAGGVAGGAMAGLQHYTNKKRDGRPHL